MRVSGTFNVSRSYYEYFRLRADIEWTVFDEFFEPATSLASLAGTLLQRPLRDVNGNWKADSDKNLKTTRSSWDTTP